MKKIALVISDMGGRTMQKSWRHSDIEFLFGPYSAIIWRESLVKMLPGGDEDTIRLEERINYYRNLGYTIKEVELFC